MATRAGSFNEAIEYARMQTGRSAVLILRNPASISKEEEPAPVATSEGPNLFSIPAGKRSLLCLTLAESSERFAAIVVEPKAEDDLVHKRFLRKTRELASAEGALLVWRDAPRERRDFYRIEPDLVILEEPTVEAK